jgi:hypothetical protein
VGRFNLNRCAAPGCDNYTAAARYCPECDGRKVLVPNAVRRCAYPGCGYLTHGDVHCVDHREV